MHALDAQSCLKTKLTRLITWVIQSHQILIMPSLTWKSFQSNSYQINISPSFMWSCPLWLKIPIMSQKFYSHHSFKLLETQFRKIGILPPTWAPANCPQPNKTLPQGYNYIRFWQCMSNLSCSTVFQAKPGYWTNIGFSLSGFTNGLNEIEHHQTHKSKTSIIPHSRLSKPIK